MTMVKTVSRHENKMPAMAWDNGEGARHCSLVPSRDCGQLALPRAAVPHHCLVWVAFRRLHLSGCQRKAHAKPCLKW